jgi:hypothetical protein
MTELRFVVGKLPSPFGKVGRVFVGPVICEIPSNLCEAAAICFLHCLGLVDSPNHVEKVLVGMLYVEVKPKGVKKSPLCSKNLFSLSPQAMLRRT